MVATFMKLSKNVFTVDTRTHTHTQTCTLVCVVCAPVEEFLHAAAHLLTQKAKADKLNKRARESKQVSSSNSSQWCLEVVHALPLDLLCPARRCRQLLFLWLATVVIILIIIVVIIIIFDGVVCINTV